MIATTTINAAIELNNEGAARLNAGHTLDALQWIRRGVVAIKECHDTSCESSITPSSSPTSSPQTPQQQQHCAYDAAHRHFPSNGLFFVYSRPLLLPAMTNNVASNGDLESLAHVVTTYLIFNLALTCHRFGMESGTQEPLDRAMELYHVLLASFRLGDFQLHTVLMNDDYAIIDSALMQCLLLNNLAHLHHQQCDYESCEWCLACLEDVVRHTHCLDENNGDCGSTLRRRCYLSDTEAEELKLNMVFVQPPSAAHAA